MKTAAVILAGGASRRLGTPKALLDYHGETFLDRLIRLFGPPCIVVLGHEPDRIRAGIRAEATFVVNQQHALGQLTSLQRGLEAVPTDNDAVFFTPVDYPAIRAHTIGAMLKRFDNDCAAVVPVYNGKHGHPVLVAGHLVPEFLALTLEQTARDVMHRHAARTRYVDVDDRGVVSDVDVPADYEALP